MKISVDKTKLYTPVYAEEIVLSLLRNHPTEKLLDFGCGDARFTKKLQPFAKKLCASDLDRNLVTANKRKYKSIEFSLSQFNCKTIYPSNYFDVVTLMGVLEHVPDESDLLKELHRILKPQGRLIMYIHNKGLLEVFDTANIKFRFPFLHKLLYRFFLGAKKYNSEFKVKKTDQKMIGDVSEGKNWHTHYSASDIKRLTKKLFVVEKNYYYSMFLPILLTIEFLYVYLFSKTNRFITGLIHLDNKISVGALSYSVVIQCRKK